MHQSLFTVDPRAARWRDNLLRLVFIPRRPRRPRGPHRRFLDRDQRGLTLLEIMIVLAIMALIMGLVVGPIVMRHFGTARKDIARAAVSKYVNEAYPMWSQANPDKLCPASIDDLSEYVNAKANKDPWSTPYRLLCGPNLPPGATGIAVASNGPDQKENTEDDVKSW